MCRFYCLFTQGWFTLKVVVIDDDNGLTDDDPVDTFIVHQTLSSTSPTRKTTFTGQRQTKPTTLDLSFTVQCDPNFYGARCSVYCQDTNSESGHYTCGSSGERVCLEGWTNPVQHCLTGELSLYTNGSFTVIYCTLLLNSSYLQSRVCTWIL